MNAQQSIFCTTAGPPFRSAKASMLTVSRAALPQNRRSSTSLQPATRKGCWCRPAHTAQPGSPAAQPSRRSASSHGPTARADTLRSRAASTRSKKPSTTSTSGAPSSSAVPQWPAPCVSSVQHSSLRLRKKAHKRSALTPLNRRGGRAVAKDVVRRDPGRADAAAAEHGADVARGGGVGAAVVPRPCPVGVRLGEHDEDRAVELGTALTEVKLFIIVNGARARTMSTSVGKLTSYAIVLSAVPWIASCATRGRPAVGWLRL